MVDLLNIKEKDDMIYFDGYPEGKDINRFKMIIDKNTFEIIKLTVPKSIYTSMARKKIKDILKSGEPLPKKAMSCWC